MLQLSVLVDLLTDTYATYRWLLFQVFLYLFDMTMQTGIQIGAFIGLILSALLFFCVPWYHSMIMWQLHHFLPLTVIGVGVGGVLALATD